MNFQSLSLRFVFQFFRHCFMRRHIRSMGPFCSSCNCMRCACRCLLYCYAWMSVSLLSIFRFNWIQSEAHSHFKMKEGDGKSTLTIWQKRPLEIFFSLSILFFSFCSLHVCLCIYTHVYLSAHKHYPYSSTGKTFICMRNFLPFSSVCYSIQFKFLFFSHSPICIVYSPTILKTHTQFEKKVREKSDAHIHAHIEKKEKERGSCDEDKDER